MSNADKVALKQATVACKAEVKGMKVRWPASRKYVKNCNHKDGGSQRSSQHEHHPSAQHGECEESPEVAHAKLALPVTRRGRGSRGRNVGRYGACGPRRVSRKWRR
jgi:hypothetical protein